MTDPVAVLLVGAALGLGLGLLGGGGGILAVPLLIAVGERFLVASSQSLIIVAAGATAALFPHHRARRVDWRVGLIFGGLGAAGAVVGARLASIISASILLGGLTLLLIGGAVAMLRAAGRERRRSATDAASGIEMAGGAIAPGPGITTTRTSRFRVVALASSVGLATGLLGVGAGFVVVPALVSAMKLPVKKATATALVVIVMNSAVALAVRHGSTGGLNVTASLAAASASFAVLGALLSRRIPGWALSTAFGVLMILVAIFTITKAVIGA